MTLPPEIPADVLSFEMPEGAEEPCAAPETALSEAAVVARAALREAAMVRKPIDRAAAWANLSAWGLAVMGVLSLPGAFGSLSGFLLVVGLGVCATLEFRGRAMLRRMEPDGARLLAKNQLLLAGVIAVYCGFNIVSSLMGAGQYDEIVATNPDLEDILGGMGDVMKKMMIGFYVVVAVVGVGFQVLAWHFHRARVTMVERYLRDTPDWVRADTEGTREQARARKRTAA